MSVHPIASSKKICFCIFVWFSCNSGLKCDQFNCDYGSGCTGGAAGFASGAAGCLGGAAGSTGGAGGGCGAGGPSLAILCMSCVRMIMEQGRDCLILYLTKLLLTANDE